MVLCRSDIVLPYSRSVEVLYQYYVVVLEWVYGVVMWYYFIVVLRCVILCRSTVLYLWGGGRHAPVLLQRQLDVQQTPRIQLNTQLLRTAGWQTGMQTDR